MAISEGAVAELVLVVEGEGAVAELIVEGAVAEIVIEGDVWAELQLLFDVSLIVCD